MRSSLGKYEVGCYSNALHMELMIRWLRGWTFLRCSLSKQFRYHIRACSCEAIIVVIASIDLLSLFAAPHFSALCRHLETYHDKLGLKRNFEEQPIFLTYCGNFLHPRTILDLTK